MKTIKFFIISLLLGLLPTLQSCSDDDKVEANDLYGKWQMVREQGYEKENGKIVEEWDDDVTRDRLFIEFEKGGSLSIWEGNEYGEGSWRLNGSKLTIIYDDDDEIFTLKIEELTSTTMVLVDEENYGGGDSFYEKTTFIKVD